MPCVNGSERVPTQPERLHLDPAYAESLLPVELLWFRPFLRYLPPLDLNLNDFCALPAPDFPSIDADELLALMDPTDATLAFLAGKKGAQLVHRLLWQIVCRCKLGEALPPVGSYPSQPAGAPALNPPSVVSPPATGTPCVTFYPPGYSTPGVLGPTGGDLGSMLFSGADVRTVRVLYNVVLAGATHPQATGHVQFINGSGGLVGAEQIFDLPPDQRSAFDFPVPIGAVRVRILALFPSPSTDLFGAAAEGYCGDTAGQSNCCGSDPRLLATLTQLQNLVQILQRYGLPFATIDGPTHAGLTGNGSFTVSRLVGLHSRVTSHTSVRPNLEGNPPYVWDQGWLSILTGEGLIEEKRVSQTDLVWMPRLMNQAITVGYSFFPGTVVDLTELLAEP